PYTTLFRSLSLFGGPAPAIAQDTDAGKGARPDVKAGDQTPPSEDDVTADPSRFANLPDEVYGAFQRGHYLTALKLGLPRAENGDGAAQTLMPVIYANALGVRQDPDEDRKWYEKAAEKVIPDAKLQFALMLIDRKLVAQDRDRAFILMRRAAEAGIPLAQFNLAQMLSGSGSLDEAVGWYE